MQDLQHLFKITERLLKMSTSKRYGADVKEKILQTAVKVWEENPHDFTVKKVSTRLGMNHANIYHHFPQGLMDAMADYALRNKNVRVICSLIVAGHKSVENLSPSEKSKYLLSL